MGDHFKILNLDTARFECTYGRGCEGICCRNGRPPVYPDEAERIESALPELLVQLRPEARELVVERGFLSNRRAAGQPMLRVVGGWCVFFNQGCVLHRAGRLRYKPSACVIFPITSGAQGEWYVRQKGFRREKWDLPCLDPSQTVVSAADSLLEELAALEYYLGEPGE